MKDKRLSDQRSRISPGIRAKLADLDPEKADRVRQIADEAPKASPSINSGLVATTAEADHLRALRASKAGE